jgi:putative transposon-encoded protein
MEVKAECYQTLDKEVSAQTSAGVIYVPKNWIGKKVRVLLLEPIEE